MRLKSGSTRSTPEKCRSASAIRGSVSKLGALGRRPDALHLPGHRHAVRRILREQLVEDARAGARQAEHEDRRADLAAEDLRLARPGVLQVEAVLEEALRVAPHQQAAEGGEARVALVGLEEEPERRAEARVAEVREPAACRCRGEQGLGVELEERQPGGPRRPARDVQRAEGQRQSRARARLVHGRRKLASAGALISSARARGAGSCACCCGPTRRGRRARGRRGGAAAPRAGRGSRGARGSRRGSGGGRGRRRRGGWARARRRSGRDRRRRPRRGWPTGTSAWSSRRRGSSGRASSTSRVAVRRL